MTEMSINPDITKPRRARMAELMAGVNERLTAARPETIDINMEDTRVRGRIIYGSKPSELEDKYHPEKERKITLRELLRLRVLAAEHIFTEDPSIMKDLDEYKKAAANVKLKGGAEILAETIKQKVDIVMKASPELYGIWKTRLTTSTHMVKIDGRIYFYDGDLTGERNFARISDGGTGYSAEALDKIKKGSYASISEKDYLAAKGGNFTGADFAEHPVFFVSSGNDAQLMKDYVGCLTLLSIERGYNEGWFSGWVPAEMKEGYGRALSLGQVGEAWYPPNNRTLDHAALIVPRETNIQI